MPEILKLAGFQRTKWVPHCISNFEDPPYDYDDLKSQLETRNGKIIYVGGFYSDKNNRLTSLKRKLGNKFDIYGRYPLNGHLLTLLSILDRKPLFYRVKPITEAQKEILYSKYSIGINMHLSSPSVEVGNARLYELAYRGVTQIVDFSNVSLVQKIFSPEKEILCYTNLDECIEQVYRLKNDNELRISLAINAYKKAIESYNYKKIMLELAEWFKQML